MGKYKKGIIHHAGQVNNATLPNGREIERTEWVFWRNPAGQMAAARTIPDDDHFIYQNLMPIPDDVVINKYNGIVPPELRGEILMCTCGSNGVVITDGPYKDMAMCRFYAQFGIHQTSAKIENGKLVLPKKIESNSLADSSAEIIEKEQTKDKITVVKKY